MDCLYGLSDCSSHDMNHLNSQKQSRKNQIFTGKFLWSDTLEFQKWSHNFICHLSRQWNRFYKAILKLTTLLIGNFNPWSLSPCEYFWKDFYIYSRFSWGDSTDSSHPHPPPQVQSYAQGHLNRSWEIKERD